LSHYDIDITSSFRSQRAGEVEVHMLARRVAAYTLHPTDTFGIAAAP